jgi:hypothetical protein
LIAISPSQRLEVDRAAIGPAATKVNWPAEDLVELALDAGKLTVGDITIE